MSIKLRGADRQNDNIQNTFTQYKIIEIMWGFMNTDLCSKNAWMKFKQEKVFLQTILVLHVQYTYRIYLYNTFTQISKVFEPDSITLCFDMMEFL